MTTTAGDAATATEVDAVEKVYAGPSDQATGLRLFPGFERGSELGWVGFGAFINNLMTVATLAPPAAVMLGLAWIDAAPARRTRHAVIAAGGSALLGMGVVFTEISSYSKDLIDKLLTKKLGKL